VVTHRAFHAMALTYKTCPKCGLERSAEDTSSAESCPSCGLIFAKYRQSRFGRMPARAGREAVDDDESPPLGERVKEV
jgi:hypothetical protein